MCNFSSDRKAKLGNTIAYIAQHVSNPSKTKVLKILYLMEETMVRRYGIPFLGLPFEVWKMGPVQKDVFVELSDDGALLKDYIDIERTPDNTLIKSRISFDADEFSELELQMMSDVVATYGNKTAKQLVDILHREDSPWYRVAVSSGMKKAFDEGLCNNSSFLIDFSEIAPADKRELYEESCAIHIQANNLRASVHV